ncbi:MAG: efflux RND transporter periplasmic adaptor subunit [Gemmataceae bacterium]
MKRITWNLIALSALSSLSVSAGCDKKSAETPAMPAPIVAVAPAVEREVVQYEYATGRVEALQDVEIRARVSGYLTKVQFKPGTEIKADSPLFQIDAEPFKADLARAQAELARAQAEVPVAEAGVARSEAQLVRALADFRRSEQMLATNAISREEYDKALATKLESEAAVKASKAKVESDRAMVDVSQAQVRTSLLNLGYCSIRSPIEGRVGDNLVTAGNLIAGGPSTTTLLTTVVSVDPMWVSFDIDENTLQRLQKAEREGKIEDGRINGEVPAEMGLAVHGTQYPLKGRIKFVNNQVDPRTGTIKMKADFANPKPANGARLLASGMFARIRIPIGKARKAMLIPDSAIQSDQGVNYALVVDTNNKAIRLDVDTGSIVDGLRVIEAIRVPGETQSRPVAPNDRFVVTGLQRVRPGMTVEPKAQGK